MEVLKVKGLRTYFKTDRGVVRAVDGVSFSLRQGETLGIVGESGAGKSVTALSIMGLACDIGAVTVDGEVWYKGHNLSAEPGIYKQVRGKKIALIPQEAGGALNPTLTVGTQLDEMLAVHTDFDGRKRSRLINELLASVEIRDPGLVSRLYPYQLSGGILQRVLLAMTLCCEPDILIADEPACSLDLTIQKEILRLLKTIREHRGMSMILISHDLGVISQNCEHILVMYSGQVMEIGPASEVLTNPLHPYMITLMSIYRCFDKTPGSMDIVNTSACLSSNESEVGCVFRHRCDRAGDVCKTTRPSTVSLSAERLVACHRLVD